MYGGADAPASGDKHLKGRAFFFFAFVICILAELDRR